MGFESSVVDAKSMLQVVWPSENIAEDTLNPPDSFRYELERLGTKLLAQPCKTKVFSPFLRLLGFVLPGPRRFLAQPLSHKGG